MNIVEVLNAYAAFITGSNLADIILEPAQRCNLAFMNNHAVANNANLRIALNLAVLNVCTRNRAEGCIARELGRRIDIRRIPTLKFTLDDSIEYSVHISEIINKLQTERAQLDANRNNAEEDKENTQNED